MSGIALLCGGTDEAPAQLPKLDYATYLGGSGADSGYAVATDSAGAIYVAGFTQSQDFSVLNALQPSFGGGSGDLFVAKLKPDGSAFEYLTYFGGSGPEGAGSGHIGGIAADPQGNAYVVGVTGSVDFPTTLGSYQTAIGSQFACDDDPAVGLCGDAFVMKISPQGNLVYSTFLGGSDYDDAKAIAVDSAGAAYITGITASPDFPTTPGAFQPTLLDVDAYLAKLSPDGSTLVYSTLLGGTGLDAGMAIAVDSSGRAYVAGTTEAADFPLKDALQTKFGGTWDAFVARANAAGTDIDFGTYLGGSGTDEAFGIALDAAGMYLTGFTDSADFPIRNAFQPLLAGKEGNGFVSKLYRESSTLAYSTFLGGDDGRSELNGIAVNSSGNAYVVGHGGSDFPVVNSLQSYAGSSDMVVAKLTQDGSGLLYSTFIGGSGLDVASSVAIDSSGDAVLAGETASSDLPVSAHAVQPILRGPSDAAAIRIRQDSSGGPIFSSPKLVVVGETYVRTWSAEENLFVLNSGNATLHIGQISGSANVRVTSDCAVLVPGARCSLSASLFVPGIGAHAGTITVFDDAPDSPQTIFVRGEGVTGGDLEVASISAGNRFTFYGTTAIPLTVTIVNHGPYDSFDVVLQSTAADCSFDCQPCYVGTIRSGAAATVRLNYVPSRYGMLQVTVRTQAPGPSPDLNASNDKQVITVTNPRYRLDPPQLVFPTTAVPFASAVQRMTLSSLDGSPLPLSIAASGDFASKLSCEAAALHCFADVTFLPSAAGTRSGTLVITEAGSGTVENVTLTGFAVLAPHAKIVPATLGFTQAMGNGGSAPQTVTVTNDGSSPLMVASITPSANFAQTNDCAASLLSGDSCHVAVRFMPASAGSAAGSLMIAHNAANLLDVVKLSGIGVPVAVLNRPSRPSTTSSVSTKLIAKPTTILVTRPARPNSRVSQAKANSHVR